MANWTSNRLYAEGSPEQISEFLETVKGKNGVLDFNAVIPRPELLSHTACGGARNIGPGGLGDSLNCAIFSAPRSRMLAICRDEADVCGHRLPHNPTGSGSVPEGLMYLKECEELLAAPPCRQGTCSWAGASLCSMSCVRAVFLPACTVRPFVPVWLPVIARKR